MIFDLSDSNQASLAMCQVEQVSKDDPVDMPIVDDRAETSFSRLRLSFGKERNDGLAIAYEEVSCNDPGG